MPSTVPLSSCLPYSPPPTPLSNFTPFYSHPHPLLLCLHSERDHASCEQWYSLNPVSLAFFRDHKHVRASPNTVSLETLTENWQLKLVISYQNKFRKSSWLPMLKLSLPLQKKWKLQFRREMRSQPRPLSQSWDTSIIIVLDFRRSQSVHWTEGPALRRSQVSNLYLVLEEELDKKGSLITCPYLEKLKNYKLQTCSLISFQNLNLLLIIWLNHGTS